MERPWLATYEKGVRAEIDADAYASVIALFDEAVENYGDAVAFECFGDTLSYQAVDQKSRAFAAYLQKEMGVKRGDRIALMTPNFFAFPIAMLGILRAGAAQVNVNPLYTAPELRHQLNDAGVETIVIFAGSTPVLAEILGETSVKRVIVINPGDGSRLPLPQPPVDERLNTPVMFADALETGSTMDFEEVALGGKDTLFFQYTGGTTGYSKGAVLTHRNMIANVMQAREFLPNATRPRQEILIGALPLYHIFGLFLSVLYISVGAKTVLIPNPRDMDAFVGALKNSRFSIIAGVNTLFAGLMQYPDFADVDFSNYRLAIGGGTAVIETTSDQWQAITGRPIIEGYGLSETSPVLTLNPQSNMVFTGCCGLPFPSTDIILRQEDGTIAAMGEPGEVCAKGPQVMNGYWNKPDVNKEAFTEDGYFRTGDVGVFDERGYLKIVDRIKDMILVSGFNVYPNEIEAVIAACPGVLESACVGVADEKTGEAVVAHVVRTAGSTVSAEEIISHCQQSLTAYKIPKQIEFLEALPKSNVGKILRRELRESA